MLPQVTARVRPPRVLSVPYPLGYPLGAPNEAALQLRVLRALLAMCTGDVVPVVEDFIDREPGQ